MKNKLIALVAALALGFGLSSCNETFAPNVDFGDKTYINDYSALANQVKNLVDKIDLLNKIIGDDYNQLIVSIDGLTQAITIQTETMDADMDRIIASLTEGFTALKTSIDYAGFSIISAINAEGELISLKIDENGKLIEAAIRGKVDELVKAINNLNLNIVERFEALDIVISSGLAEMVVKVNLDSDELIAELKNINDALGQINTSIFEGFKALNETIVTEDEKIIYAINEKGDLLALHLDANGNLLSAAIKCQTDELVKALNSQTTSLVDRVDALNLVISSGLAKITVEGGGVIGEALKLALGEVNDAIKGLGDNLLSGFSMLGTILDENGNLVIKAINAAGEKISLTIDNNGYLIAVKLDAVVKSIEELMSVLESTNATLSQKLEALNSAIEQKLGDIELSIEKQTKKLKLAIDGVSTSLLDGFNTLNETITDEGQKIVYALNANGYLISLKIDENGKLISGSVEGLTSELVKIVSDESAKWDARVVALNTILASGLADIEVAVGKVGEEISLNLVDIDESLEDISLALFHGFAMTSKTITDTGDAIVEAMNDNGEKLMFIIDKHGNLIKIALDNIVDSIDDLIAALESQTLSLADKFEALSEAIAKGLGDIKVSVDEQTRTLALTIDNVKTALFAGFRTLNETLTETGDKMIYAINENGELISVTVDNNGKLIADAIEGLAADLVKTVNDASAALAQRICCFNKIVESGLAQVSVKIGEVGGMLDIKLTNIDDAIRDLDGTIFEGFHAISTKLDENGNKIVTAIGENGEKIALAIDENGNLINVTLEGIADALDKLYAILEDAGKTLAEKVDALNKAVTDGLAGIKASIDIYGYSISLELDGIKSTLFDGFSLLSTDISANGDIIAEAIDEIGNKISVTIDKNGYLIGVKLEAINQSLQDLLALLEDQNKDLADKFDALNDAIEQKLGEIVVAIDNQTKKLKLSIEGVDATLLDGFKTLNETNVTELEKLIYAINSNGELISMKIDNNGELICGALVGQTEALAKLIADESAKWDERIKALNALVGSGLAGIEVAVSQVGEDICVNLTDIDDSLGDINLTLLDGFKMTRKTIKETGEAIIEAMNTNGDKLVFTIDKHGNLIEIALGEIVASLQELLDILEDQNRDLADKFDALSEAILNGLEGISVSFDKQLKKLILSVDGVNSTLLDGFRTLNETNVTELEKLIYAINDKGDLISLKIDNSGKLIADAIEGNVDELVAAINNNGELIAKRIAAMNKILEAGLADVIVKIGEVGGMLDIRLTGIDDAIRSLSGTLFEGLKLVGQKLDDNGNNILTAINGNGEKIALVIDEKGNLISLALEGLADAIDELIAFLESKDAGIAEKIEALQKALEGKVAEVTAAINGSTGLISAALGNVSLSFLNGFTTLTQKFDDLGNLIAAAINKQGEGIILKIDEKGNLINASIELGAAAICDALKDQNKSLAEKLDALNKALADGFLALNADLDAVTGAIKMNYDMLSKIDVDFDADLKALTEALKNGLDKIFDGLGTLSVKVDANGDKIVTALNQNGEAIKLQIKASGEVIEASLDDNTTALIAALKNNETSLEAKLDALNDALESGFGDITLSIEGLEQTIHTDLGALQNAASADLKAIKDALEDILGGLTTLNVTVGDNGDKIVTALNENGDIIKLQIKESGELVSGQIDTSAKAIVEALGNESSSLESKLEALQGAIDDGLATIKVAIDDQSDILSVDLGALEDAVKGLAGDLKEGLEDVLDGLTALKTEINADGSAIVTAITTEGEAIKLQIDNTGKLLEASLDDNTTALIEALGDQNTSLEAKLEALGNIIKEGLGDIKVELGNLYGELKLDLGGLGDIIKEGFEGVTGGLTELKSQMNADGTAIVNAITAKGDLIQGQIDASGKLIEAAIKGNTTDLKAALEALGTSSQAVADKVDALNTTVNTGLGNITTSIDAQTGKIETGFTDLSGKLGNINDNILEGFTGLHTDMGNLVAAINAMRDTLKIHIDANTEAILKLDGDLKTSLKALADSLSAVGGKIVIAINGQKEAIVLGLSKDGAIAKAVVAGTAEIVAAIGAQTTSLSAILNDEDGGLPAILTALGVEHDDLQDILEKLEESPEVDLSEIINRLDINNHLLTELLAISDGVYLDSKDKVKVGEDSLYNYIYITAEVRNAADQSEETAEALMSLLVGKSMAEPSKKQYCTTTPSTTDVKEHSHCFWKKVNEVEPYLKYTNVTTDVDDKSLLKMEKYYSESYWELKIHDVCSYAHIYSIQINDARDLDHYVQYYKSELTQNEAGNKTTWNKGYVNEKAGTTYMGPLVVKFVCYDKATGEYCDSPNVRVYCQLSGSGQGSSKDISDKCKDGTPYPDGVYHDDMKDDGYWTSKPWTSLTKVGDTAIAIFDK